jgi:hypothetical protein
MKTDNKDQAMHSPKKSLAQRLEELLESEEGKKLIRQSAERIMRKDSRAIKADGIFSQLDYEKKLELIERIEKKHDQRWEDLCQEKGFQPYPWEIVHVLFRAAEIFGTHYEGEPLDSFDTHFGAYTKQYGDLYFNWIYGQGTVIRIFDRDKREIFRS